MQKNGASAFLLGEERWMVATDARKSGEGVPGTGTTSSAPVAPLGHEDRYLTSRHDLTRLHRKARPLLDEALSPGEEPRLVIAGLASAALVAAENCAFVFKAGARAGLPFSARLKEFEYETVMRVDLHSGGEVDVIVIHAPLQISSCSSYWADGRDDPWKARNAIPVRRGSAQAERGVHELARLVAEFRSRSAGRTGRAPQHAPVTKKGTPGLVEHIAGLEESRARTEILPVPREQSDEQTGGAAAEECPRCGNQLSAGWQFCPRCGTRAGLKRPARYS